MFKPASNKVREKRDGGGDWKERVLTISEVK